MLCRHAEEKSEAWAALGASAPEALKEQRALARRAAEAGQALGKAVEHGRPAAAMRLLALLRSLAVQPAGQRTVGPAASTADSLVVSLLYGARQALRRAARGKGPAGLVARKRELAPLLEALVSGLPPAWAPMPSSLLTGFAELGDPPADLALCLAPWAPGLHARCATPAFKAAARELCRAASGRALAGGGAPSGTSLLPALPQEVVQRMMELAARPWSEWVERDAQDRAAEVGT